MVTTRRATIEDRDAVFELLSQLAVSYPAERGAFERDFPKLLESPDVELLVGCVGGMVAGYALACRAMTLFAGGPIMEMYELIVAPAHRRLGVGRALTEAVVERAWRCGCREVVLATRRAGGFYAKLGFQETASYFKLKRSDG